ncbi:beta-hydroxyacyl-ACP dehydratase [Oenococcus sicerae]|uniref:Beta-hydroxyacyl-ACP dehydratase n=1 Tax=Oenococcus sicerae TaxID=2203724 RepID=A0AAJ1R9A4_9LACO|nr:3-hydroxyacyl-ACP dehydratase FabZ [Oenococcus sicerae]MDN6900554.1 beta-hydroxyacyl-ACP dehydratase [Oenococcus sicerae]QAS69429.1 beta-hydroxyacyl-ACP dehydratase [Oenococcus sicerae]
MLLNAQQIADLIPNRYPIAWIDGVTKFVPDESITAVKNVTINEHFMHGRKDLLALPNIFLIEMLAQAASILILKSPQFAHKTAYLGGIHSARFQRSVTPGEQLEFTILLTKVRENMGVVDCTALVGDETICQAQLLFVVSPEAASPAIEAGKAD